MRIRIPRPRPGHDAHAGTTPRLPFNVSGNINHGHVPRPWLTVTLSMSFRHQYEERKIEVLRSGGSRVW